MEKLYFFFQLYAKKVTYIAKKHPKKELIEKNIHEMIPLAW